MSHTHVSKDHHQGNDEVSYSFVHDHASSGGMVKILAFNEGKFVQSTHGMKLPMPLGEFEVPKNALISFVAHLVRVSRAAHIEDMNDLQVLRL